MRTLNQHISVGRTMVLRDLVALAVQAKPAAATALWLGGTCAAWRMAEGRPRVREQAAPDMSQICGEQERMSAWELASRQP